MRGLAYKLARGKLKRETVLTMLEKTEGGYTQGVEDTLRYMLGKLLPDDTEEGENEEVHDGWRRAIEEPSQEGSMEEVEGGEVEKAVKGMRSRKAPGYDGIRAEHLKGI